MGSVQIFRGRGTPPESRPHRAAGVFLGSSAWEKPCNNEESLVVGRVRAALDMQSSATGLNFNSFLHHTGTKPLCWGIALASELNHYKSYPCFEPHPDEINGKLWSCPAPISVAITSIRSIFSIFSILPLGLRTTSCPATAAHSTASHGFELPTRIFWARNSTFSVLRNKTRRSSHLLPKGFKQQLDPQQKKGIKEQVAGKLNSISQAHNSPSPVPREMSHHAKENSSGATTCSRHQGHQCTAHG